MKKLTHFKKLINHGLGSVMVAHLNIPSLDDTENLASTLSPKIVNGLLKNEMKFTGLAITDALNMKGVSQYFEPGIVDVKALLAGNDVLLFSEDVPKAIIEIKKAISKKQISELQNSNSHILGMTNLPLFFSNLIDYLATNLLKKKIVKQFFKLLIPSFLPSYLSIPSC